MIDLLVKLRSIVIAAVFGAFFLGIGTKTSALTRCATGVDCASGSCRQVSQGPFFNCNAIGKAFGCKNDNGGCSLFCSGEVLNKLACMRSCTTNADCDAGDRCRAGACRKTPA